MLPLDCTPRDSGKGPDRGLAFSFWDQVYHATQGEFAAKTSSDRISPLSTMARGAVESDTILTTTVYVPEVPGRGASRNLI